MRKLTLTLTGCCLVLFAAHGPAVDVGNQAAAHAILDRAIAAMGGKEQLTKRPAIFMKVRGTYNEHGKDVPFSGEWALDGPNMRTVMKFDNDKALLQEIRIVNGAKGWLKVNEEATQELDPESLATEQEQMYFSRVTTLVPLKDRGYQLIPLGDSKVGDREVVGIKVSSEGHQDVKLFFDKKTHLILKTERLVPSADQDQLEEIVFTDYRDVDGIKQPTRVSWKIDRKPFCEMRVTEVQVKEKLDGALFAKP